MTLLCCLIAGAVSAETAQRLTPQVMASAVYAPRPPYPFEARSKHITGSGVFVFGVDLKDGHVTGYKIVRSTGSPILDNATLAAFRQWRFQLGTLTRIIVPVTFTMVGANY
jgi:TonB family protein